ncbi:hypothetical protein [Streptomyces sp. NPDC056883]|uniref:hypothetical protein n=1 Tax=Streptomyces sp. NPDC056883 TaxID=3345959 RepID=UPI0036BA77DF
MTIDHEPSLVERVAESLGLTPEEYIAKLTTFINPTVTSISPAALHALASGTMATGASRLSARPA